MKKIIICTLILIVVWTLVALQVAVVVLGKAETYSYLIISVASAVVSTFCICSIMYSLAVIEESQKRIDRLRG